MASVGHSLVHYFMTEPGHMKKASYISSLSFFLLFSLFFYIFLLIFLFSFFYLFFFISMSVADWVAFELRPWSIVYSSQNVQQNYATVRDEVGTIKLVPNVFLSELQFQFVMAGK